MSLICFHFKYTYKETMNLNYIQYIDFLREISLHLNFESYKGIIGNSYAESAGDILSEINPLNYRSEEDQIASTPKVSMDMLIGLGLIK